MKVVVGLGNPGRQYDKTRHNVGFRVIEELARRQGVAFTSRQSFEAETAEIFLDGKKTLLAAPQTYMNLSGRSVRRFFDYYDMSPDDLLIVCDDLNLPIGKLRMRAGGSAGGQKGLNNIIHRLGSENIGRLRIGIGQAPGKMDAADYVLGKFRTDETSIIDHAVVAAADGVEMWIREGLEPTMNVVNAPSTE